MTDEHTPEFTEQSMLDIIPAQAAPFAALPVISVEVMLERLRVINEIKARVMEEGKHYGVIPGVEKPSLWKPGAEILCIVFGLVPHYEPMETPDFAPLAAMEPLEDVPFLVYQYRCILTTRDGLYRVGEGIGSCNSLETKYRYRNASRLCPYCNKGTIIKGKAEYGGGWLCFAKKGGCGQKFLDGDQRIEGQTVGQIPNPDIADYVNTLDKMAQKRALVAATLVAVGGSEIFTQDVEDLPLDGSGPTGKQQQQAGSIRDKVIIPIHHNVDDLMQQPMNTLSGEQLNRCKRWSLANCNGLTETAWLMRYSAYFGNAKLNTLGLTVEEFIGTMATQHESEDAPPF